MTGIAAFDGIAAAFSGLGELSSGGGRRLHGGERRSRSGKGVRPANSRGMAKHPALKHTPTVLMNKGVPAADVQELEELTNKLLAPTVLDREQTFEYERAFEDIVRTSSLPDNKKEDFILSGSVAIMSTDFWKSKQQSN